MSTTVTLTPQQMADEAAAIRRRVLASPWPEPGTHGYAAVRWALDYLTDAEAERAAVLCGELDPWILLESDEDTAALADEVTAERVLDAAKALENRHAKYAPQNGGKS